MSFSTYNFFDPENPHVKKARELIANLGKGGPTSLPIPYGFASIGNHQDPEDAEGGEAGETGGLSEEKQKYHSDFDSFANSLLKGGKPVTHSFMDDPKLSDRQKLEQHLAVLRNKSAPYHLYDFVRQNHASLQKHYNFSDLDAETIHKYVTGSSDMNKSLYNGHVIGEIKHGHPVPSGYSAYHIHNGPHLDHILSTRSSPHDAVLYSGIRRNPGKLAGHGGVIHFPAYTSTSIDPEAATPFSRKSPHHMERDVEDAHNEHILRIHWPKGSSGSYLSSEKTISPGLSHEKEFLLPRGINMKIGKPQVFDSGLNKRVHYWDVHPVSGHEAKK